MRLALVISILALASCATQEELVQKDQTFLDKTCTGYGFVKGTPAYTQCWMRYDKGRGWGGARTRTPIPTAE